MRPTLALAAGLVLALGASGCLTNAYSVPRDEALRLAQLDPSIRGTAVRVVQQTSLEEPPSRAPAQPVFVPGGSYSVGIRTNPHPSGGGGGGLPLPRDGRGAAMVILGAALIAGVAIAATEGVRYDGWARLAPMHPLHLTYADGTEQWMPLAALTPEAARAASRVVLRDDEGPLEDLGRAPLNRVGATYGVELGAGGVLSPAAPPEIGLVSHIQIGGFPVQWLGLLADVSFGFGPHPFGLGVGGELQLLPVDLGALHLGVYGRAGYGYAEETLLVAGHPTNEHVDGLAWGAGGLVQLEVSTRLALVLRGGVVGLGDRDPTWEVTAGMAVY